MAISNILTHVDNSSAVEHRFSASIKLVRQHQAQHSGLYVVPVYGFPVYAEVEIGADICEEAKRATWERAREVQNKYEGVCEREGQSIEWYITEGNLIATLSEYARYTDLLILGQGQPEDPEDMSSGIADHVVLECGTPCLVVPYIGIRKSLGKRILVLWNASRECARAVKDAIPLLIQADRVELLSVNPGRGDVDEAAVPGLDISSYLARHEIKAITHRIDSNQINTGDIILSYASDIGADMIVMGAYGHSRLREVILGGVTKHLLKHMTVPVFMSH